jgi:hypothetical protein
MKLFVSIAIDKAENLIYLIDILFSSELHLMKSLLLTYPRKLKLDLNFLMVGSHNFIN